MATTSSGPVRRPEAAARLGYPAVLPAWGRPRVSRWAGVTSGGSATTSGPSGSLHTSFDREDK